MNTEAVTPRLIGSSDLLGAVVAKLYRDQNDEDVHWHHVGPLHERCAFNLLDMVGYAPSKGDKPPFHLYNVYQWTGAKVPDKTYATLPAVKRAGRAWIKSWLPTCDGKSVEWEKLDTGVHFIARVNGMKIANYYYCPEATGQWHKGFRVWFGGTYYLVDFANPSEAESAVAATWRRWLQTAREKLLKAPNEKGERRPVNAATTTP